MKPELPEENVNRPPPKSCPFCASIDLRIEIGTDCGPCRGIDIEGLPSFDQVQCKNCLAGGPLVDSRPAEIVLADGEEWLTPEELWENRGVFEDPPYQYGPDSHDDCEHLGDIIGSCPFCGERNLISLHDGYSEPLKLDWKKQIAHDGFAHVFCEHCGANGPHSTLHEGDWAEHKAVIEAIQEWKRRTSRDAPNQKPEDHP